MSQKVLTLYSRQGCCLCEGLESRLKSLPLHNLRPPLVLRVIDIDSSDVPKEVRDRYDSEVPVLLVEAIDINERVELPRVSPRLNKEGLFKWLQKLLANFR